MRGGLLRALPSLWSRAASATGVTLAAVALVLGLAFPSAVLAQKVYRCGASYSHLPCEGGKPLASHDLRTADQTREAQLAARQERIDGDTLEKERLGQEAAARGRSRPKTAKALKIQSAEYKATAALPKKKKKAGKADDGFFTVADPATLGKKKKKSPTKTAKAAEAEE